MFPDGHCLKEVKRGLGLQAEEQEGFPSQGLKTAALCHSTSSCFFLAEKQSKKPPPFIRQINKGLERAGEDEARERLKGLKRKDFSFNEPLTAVGDSQSLFD